MADKETNESFGESVDGGHFTEAELELVANINGWSIETLNDRIYRRYGYRDCEQLKNSE